MYYHRRANGVNAGSKALKNWIDEQSILLPKGSVWAPMVKEWGDG